MSRLQIHGLWNRPVDKTTVFFVALQRPVSRNRVIRRLTRTVGKDSASLSVWSVQRGQNCPRVRDIASIALDEGAPAFRNILEVLKDCRHRLVSSCPQVPISLLRSGACHSISRGGNSDLAGLSIVDLEPRAALVGSCVEGHLLGQRGLACTQLCDRITVGILHDAD